MKRLLILVFRTMLIGFCEPTFVRIVPKVVDIPARPGVTQRFLLLSPDNPKAAVVLFPGGPKGQGGIQRTPGVSRRIFVR